MTVNELLQIPYFTDLIQWASVFFSLMCVFIFVFCWFGIPLLDIAYSLLRFKYIREKEKFDKEYPDKKGLFEKLALKIKNRKRK